MRATVIHAPNDIRVEEVPDAAVRTPTDAVVRVVLACICGSDLWAYRGVAKRQPGQRIGHEFLGVVEAVGAGVTSVRAGDLVVAPFVWSDGVCDFCREGLQTSCPHGGFWGEPGSDGGQGEAVRVPYADGTLVKLPAEAAGDERLLTAMLALSDVMSTGHHAALAAQVRPGTTVAVVGDGAVGLCGVLAARRLGAEQIIALGRHTARTDIARSFGATDVVAERGDAAIAAVKELTKGLGAHAVLEAVGTEESMRTAISIARDGGAVGYVGVPHGGSAGVDIGQMFGRNVALGGGVAPARAYIPELLADVLDGAIDPSPVFDRSVTLDQVPDGYRAMDERTALKVRISF
ncbi:zinc-dependent alcohol dehydrogenase family protein [Micromonospora sp. 4G57]|uniref:Zinc-dependent alcohol dehydrogenase family protein n=1 Tax=Micromonospora sicca TaxID=2202420 RepID=A0ABU5JCX0_9ACTN|nr:MULTISPECIES: zinc-dependent alcohol dehydrogenase family protein [unclassified Micromonospora]MDZ5441703.1 zinc-dependent alcohol dehydrogenase family protein [Micromonospora sp. 4G57]MDZ5490264.1 zinc-dependent alcohol dehydrogenase family protein [Micromonospora sp. 4G53]